MPLRQDEIEQIEFKDSETQFGILGELVIKRDKIQAGSPMLFAEWSAVQQRRDQTRRQRIIQLENDLSESVATVRYMKACLHKTEQERDAAIADARVLAKWAMTFGNNGIDKEGFEAAQKYLVAK